MAKAGQFCAHVTDQQLRAWRRQQVSVEAIASLIGSTPTQVSARLYDIWSKATKGDDHEAPDPETIRQRCLEIQAGWTEEERRRRAGYRGEAVNTIVVPESRIVSGSL